MVGTSEFISCSENIDWFLWSSRGVHTCVCMHVHVRGGACMQPFCE